MENALFKDMYLFELNRKEQLSDSMNSLITVLAILGGLLGFITQNYRFSTEPLSLLSLVFLCPAIILYGAALYHSILHFYLANPGIEKSYQAIPKSSDLNAYYNQLVLHFEIHPDPKGNAETYFNMYLNDRYAEATDINAAINDYRGERQRKAFKILSIMVVFAFFSTVPLFAKNIDLSSTNTLVNSSQEIKK